MKLAVLEKLVIILILICCFNTSQGIITDMDWSKPLTSSLASSLSLPKGNILVLFCGQISSTFCCWVLILSVVISFNHDYHTS